LSFVKHPHAKAAQFQKLSSDYLTSELALAPHFGYFGVPNETFQNLIALYGLKDIPASQRLRLPAPFKTAWSGGFLRDAVSPSSIPQLQNN
jgi:hypothetical protein